MGARSQQLACSACSASSSCSCSWRSLPVLVVLLAITIATTLLPHVASPVDAASAAAAAAAAAGLWPAKTMQDMGHTFLTTAADAREMRRELTRYRTEAAAAIAAEEAEEAEAIAELTAAATGRVTSTNKKQHRVLAADITDMDWTDDRPHNESFFMPSECDYDTRSCCLEYEGEVCGGYRGVCKNITIDDSVCERRIGLFWFTDSFDFACVCEGHHWGAACEECAPGWTGENCTEIAPLLVRRDFASLTEVDKQYVIDAFRLAKITPHPYRPVASVFDYWALLHHWSLLLGVMEDRLAIDGLSPMIAEGHGGGAIPYHRSLVRGMERALQYVLANDTFAMPYWNFTGSAGDDNDLTLKWFGGDGTTNAVGSSAGGCRLPEVNGIDNECMCEVTRGPFRDWPLVGDWAYPLNLTVGRAFGCKTNDAPSTPSQLAAECAIRIDRFDIVHDPDVMMGHNDSEAPAEPTPDNDVTDPQVMLKLQQLTPAQQKRAKAQAQVLASARAEAHAESLARAQAHAQAQAQVGVGDGVIPGVYFHNLLGGGVLCDESSNGGAATWPYGFTAPVDLHKRAHQWLAGSMVGNHPASDPIFWMLHSYADVIYEQWLRSTAAVHHFDLSHSWSRYVGTYGNTRMECQGPFYPLRQAVTAFVDSREMGFTYELFDDLEGYPGFKKAYYDFQWHWPYPHMDELLISDDVKLVVKDAIEIPRDTSFFVPTGCALSGSAASSSCCPTYLDQVCGGATRGTCMNLTDGTATTSLKIDIENHPNQLWWLTSTFTAVCVCSGNYDGVNCGVCKPGYEGPTCSITSVTRVRRDFDTLSTEDMQYVVDAFRLARQAQSAYQPGVTVLAYFASMVYWHRPGNTYLRAEDAEPHTKYAWHGNVLWHRELLARLERELGRITQNDSFVLPYWDWSTAYNNDLEPVYRWFGGDGDTFSSVEDDLSVEICRRPSASIVLSDVSLMSPAYGGCNCSVTRKPFMRPPLFGLFAKRIGTVQRTFACLIHIASSLPTPLSVEYTAQIENFYATDESTECFAKALTGIIYPNQTVQTWPTSAHGDMMMRVQNWMGGTSTTPDYDNYRSVRSSPGSDPMWYMALGFQDLILERWIRRADANAWRTVDALPIADGEPGMNRGEVMAPFFPLKTNAQAFVSSLATGYTFDFFATHPEDRNFH